MLIKFAPLLRQNGNSIGLSWLGNPDAQSGNLPARLTRSGSCPKLLAG